MPATAAEAMARAQMLLNFPPVAEKMDEWRATIQSLIGFAEASKSQQMEPSRRPQSAPASPIGGRADGTTLTVQSPPRQQPQQQQRQQPRQAQQSFGPDEMSIASSDP
jgi:hypothetical protein